jgi:hypothetical protein
MGNPKNKPTIFEWISIAGAIIAIIISIWSVNKSESIAERSGSFQKGELGLIYSGFPILPNKLFEVYSGLDFTDSTFYFFNLPFAIKNTGEKTVEDINLLIQYPNMAHLAIIDTLQFEGIQSNTLTRSFYRDKPFDQINYNVRSINPQFSISSEDLIMVSAETITNIEGEIETADAKRMSYKSWVAFSYQTEVTIGAKDLKTKQYRFNLNFRNANDLNILVKDIIKEKIKSKDPRKVVKVFFVSIPQIAKRVEKNERKIAFTECKENNTLLLQLDEELDLMILNAPDGRILDQLEVKDLDNWDLSQYFSKY